MIGTEGERFAPPGPREAAPAAPGELRERRPGPPPVRSRASWWPAAIAVVAALIALSLAGLALLARLAPSLPNPFAVERTERSGPVVLRALEDLSEYHAATGHFEVIIDVEKDARFLPSSLRGERTLFVAAGTVDAIVDFSGIGEDAVAVSEDRRQVAIRLPTARLSPPRIDPERSYIYERRRGLLDRLGSLFGDDPNAQRELYVLAQERLGAAAEETDLLAVAERNTSLMLQGLLRSLGFTDVDIRFG
jgi:hypothetical protein